MNEMKIEMKCLGWNEEYPTAVWSHHTYENVFTCGAVGQIAAQEELTYPSWFKILAMVCM